MYSAIPATLSYLCVLGTYVTTEYIIILPLFIHTTDIVHTQIVSLYNFVRN